MIMSTSVSLSQKHYLKVTPIHFSLQSGLFYYHLRMILDGIAYVLFPPAIHNMHGAESTTKPQNRKQYGIADFIAIHCHTN